MIIPMPRMLIEMHIVKSKFIMHLMGIEPLLGQTHRVVRVNPELQRGPPDVKDVGSMAYLLRRAAVAEQSLPKEEHMCTVGNRTLGGALPELVEITFTLCPRWRARVYRKSCLHYQVSVLLLFNLSLFPLRIETFALCHCVLEGYDLLSDVIGTNSSGFALSLRKLNLELLKQS